MRRAWLFIVALIAIGGAFYFGFIWPMRDPHPVTRPVRGVLAIRDVKVYPSPEAAAIEHATIVVRDGRIAAVGKDVVVPADARVLSCIGCVVTAGYWNTHVHFTEAKWSNAAWKDSGTLNAQLADMLTSRGFTTVVDLGSDLRSTLSLRRRIASGDLRGPRIYTAGSGIFPPNGIPYYLQGLPALVRWMMPQPTTAAAATRVVARNFARGADVVKLFTGSIIKRGTVLPMPLPIARAAVSAAHADGRLAFSHPSDSAGTQVAIGAGIDVLAHAPSYPKGLDSLFIATITSYHVSMIPTLKMFATTVSTDSAYLQPIYQEVRRFHEMGGRLLFGTDVGYMTDYATEDEFRALKTCGLGATDILRMLTTAPAELFKVARGRGTVAPGKAADLVLLGADPSVDVTNFARVVATVRDGEVIFATADLKTSAP